MNYALLLLGVISIILSLKERKWIYTLISCSLTVSPLLLVLDDKGLFYHSLGLLICSTISMVIVIFIDKAGESRRSVIASVLILIPYILVCTFKMLQLWGITYLTWGLLIGLLSFMYLTFERRKFDYFWFILLFIALSSGLTFFVWQ